MDAPETGSGAGPGVRRGILVTRPEPGLGETMQAVSALGFDPVACPLLQVRDCPRHLPQARAVHAILLTSGQAIAALVEAAAHDPALRNLPLLAVGDATAARAQAAGFVEVASAGGNASDLQALVQARIAPGRRLLLATASGQGVALAATLRRAGYRLHRRVVYAARPVRHLPVAAEAALRSHAIVAALFFSAETARNFERLCPVLLRPLLGAIRAMAISPAVGSALAGPWRSVEVASHPDGAAMLSLLRRVVPGAAGPSMTHAGDSS